MKHMIFRLLVNLCWTAINMDWAFYAVGSLERSVFESIRRASIDMENIQKAKHWERIHSLKDKGTKA